MDKLLVFAFIISSLPMFSQNDAKLAEENKEYIESIKSRITSIEKDTDSAGYYLINKLQDSLTFLNEALERAKVNENKRLANEISKQAVLVYFSIGKHDLSDIAKKTINKYKSNFLTTEYILINGYSDSTGSKLINDLLSMKRSEEVRNFLHQDYGIPKNKIFINWHGNTGLISERKCEINLYHRK